MLRDARFGPGKYFVNVSLLDPSGRHLDDARQAVSFNAAQDERVVGVNFITPEFKDLGQIHGDDQQTRL